MLMFQKASLATDIGVLRDPIFTADGRHQHRAGIISPIVDPTSSGHIVIRRPSPPMLWATVTAIMEISI